MKTKTIVNTSPYHVVHAFTRAVVAVRQDKAQADAECLRLNRQQCTMMPDGHYDHDRVTYVVAYRPEYIRVQA